MVGEAGVSAAVSCGVSRIVVSDACGSATAAGRIRAVPISDAGAAAPPASGGIGILTAIVIGDTAIAASMACGIGADAGVMIGDALMSAASVTRTIGPRTRIVVAKSGASVTGTVRMRARVAIGAS